MRNLSLAMAEGKSWKRSLRLLAELAELDKRIEVARQEARKDALLKIQVLMAEFDIKPRELRKPRNTTYNVKPTKPRYRDPATGATWSGRGHVPKWIVGHDWNQFLIDEAGELGGNRSKPRYRNPVTGETWSGLGREPRWIAGRDRRPFWIEAVLDEPKAR